MEWSFLEPERLVDGWLLAQSDAFRFDDLLWACTTVGDAGNRDHGGAGLHRDLELRVAPDTDGGIRFLAAMLKLAAIALIAFCLLEPMRSGTRPRPQANVLPILVDNSQSMQLKSSTAKQSRNNKSPT